MKPLHGEIKRLSGKNDQKCPCCKNYTKHSKHNAAGKNNGKSSARQNSKKLIKEEENG